MPFLRKVFSFIFFYHNSYHTCRVDSFELPMCHGEWKLEPYNRESSLSFINRNSKTIQQNSLRISRYDKNSKTIDPSNKDASIYVCTKESSNQETNTSSLVIAVCKAIDDAENSSPLFTDALCSLS